MYSLTVCNLSEYCLKTIVELELYQNYFGGDKVCRWQPVDRRHQMVKTRNQTNNAYKPPPAVVVKAQPHNSLRRGPNWVVIENWSREKLGVTKNVFKSIASSVHACVHICMASYC